MRKITRDAAIAFRDGVPFNRDNTSVSISPSGKLAILKLHGHPIARCRANRGIEITTAGHDTVTTRARLNGLLEILGASVRVRRKRGSLYFGDTKWDGDWIRVTLS